jgi:signal transduction histidine kinase
MQTYFLAGVVFAWVITYIGIGLSFSIAYLIHRRETEQLVFGLHSLAFAIFSIGLTLAYIQKSEGEGRLAVLIAVGGFVLACPLLVHFALLVANVMNTSVILPVMYGVAFLFEIGNAAGWLAKVSGAEPVHLGPFVIENLHVEAKPLGLALACAMIVAAVATLSLLVRAVVGGRRDAIVPLIGSICMGATMIHDAFKGMGMSSLTWLAPFGNPAFVFSTTGAFLVRSSLLSKELTDQSIELKNRTGELQRSYEELREAQRELTRKEQLAAVGELAAVIAHEVRNPLAIISNAVAGLRRRDIGEEDRVTLLAILKEESSRLNRLVGDLLRYARPVNVQLQLVSMREIIDRILSSTTIGESMNVEVAEETDVHAIWGDPGLLRQVFDNLIENAVQSMGGSADSVPPGVDPGLRSLYIAVRSAKRNAVEGVEVDVRDTGEGMEPHVRIRAKDPFFTTRPSGTGLGLAIVDRIVDAHDGEIRIDSESGKGTTVSVFLPVGAPVPASVGALAGARESTRLSAVDPAVRREVL